MLNVSEYIKPIKEPTAERHTVTILLRKIYSTAREEGFYTLNVFQNIILQSLKDSHSSEGLYFIPGFFVIFSEHDYTKTLKFTTSKTKAGNS
jgi:hypothetical protein